jgi:malate/lactate dehydrogenase
MIKKKGIPFFVELNSHQKYFGTTGFVTKVVDLTSGLISTVSNGASEIVEDISDAGTATVDAAAAIKDKSIVVQSGHSLSGGMVFEDANGNKYYIESVDDTTINLKFPLEEPIAFGDTLTQVGNTGIYKIEITIRDAGNYGIYISNPAIGLRSKGIQCTIKDIVIEDIADKIDTLAASLQTALEEIESTADDSETHDFTVFAG